MSTQTTAPATTDPTPPKLISPALPSGTAGSMSIALDFNTTMAAGSGTVIVTDGAVQTVIDRATGQPTLRVVGATDTHTMSASSLVINSNEVKLNVTGLLAGHTYSVVMGADVLQSTSHVAFGGVRSTSLLTFTTPAAPDTQGPTLVEVATDGGVLKAGGSIAVTITFSEAVANLPADALAAPHAGVAGLTTADGGITWHATLTAPADATTATGNILTLDMTRIADLAGNHGSGTSNLASYAVDTQAPTATVTLDTTTVAAGRDAVATIQFSEAVTGLTEAALSAGHATVSNLHTTDGGITWLATLGGTAATTADGNVLAVDLAQVHDLAGNAGSGSAVSAAYTVDTQGPAAVAIALDGATLAKGKAVHATFTFAESVHDLPFSAITAPHATVSDIATSDGGKTWTATLTANDSGTWIGNTVGVDLTKLVDLAGNPGSGMVQSGPYTVDTQGPAATLELNGTAMHTGGSLGLTLHFSEAVTDLTPAALRAPNALLTNLQHSADYLTWTATLTPLDGVTATSNVVGLDLAQVHDAAGNAGSGSTFSANYGVDTQGPNAVAIALDGAALGSAHGIHATFTFAESLQDLPLAAIVAPHAQVSGIATSDGGKTWTATLTADGSGTWDGNTVGLDLSKVQDLAGNTGSGFGASGTYAVDTVGPGATAALDGTSLTIQFSEAVTDLTAAALLAPDATLTNLQHSADYLTWTATSTPLVVGGSNAVTLDLTQVHDALGNQGSGTVTAGAVAPGDTTPPTVLDILFDGTTIGPAYGVGFTITFSESVSGLTAAALQAPHASVSVLSTLDGGKTWTGTLTAADGAASSTGNLLGVDLTQVHDAAGNAGVGTASSLSHYDVDTDPLMATVSLDRATALVTGGTVGVAIHFSAAVSALDATALAAPHAKIADLHHSDDNLTWYATLSAADAGIVADTNAVTVDLSRVHDMFGNAGSGTAVSGNYTFDTTVAAYVSSIAISDEGPSATDGITNAGPAFVAGYFVGTLADNQHLEVTLDGQAVDPYGLYVETPSNGMTYWYYANEGYLAEGAHTYTATIVDDAGHASATQSKQFTLDLTAPNLTGSPDGSTAFDVAGNLVLTFDKAVYWTVGEGNYSGLQFYDHDGGSTYVNLTDANFSSDRKTITLTPDELHLGTGNDYTLYLPYTLTDLAGNRVANSGIGFHTAGTYVDVTPPSATSLTAGTGGYYGIGSTIDIRVSFSEPVNVAGDGMPVLLLNNGSQAVFLNMSDDHRSAVFEYTVAAGDQDVAGLDIANRSDLAGHFADGAGHLLDQTHIAFGYLADAGGYSHTIQVDAHAPNALPAPQLASVSDTGTVGDDVTSIVAPTITGSGADAWAKIDLYVGDKLAASGQADGSGNWTIDSVLLGLDGQYTVKAVQLDNANNAGALSQPLTIAISGASAAVTRLDAGVDNGLSATDNVTNLTKPGFTGTVGAGTKVTVWDGSTALGTTTAGSDGVWHFAPGWDLASGQHTITLELTDAGGNVTPRELSAPYTFTIDANAPGAPGAPLLDAASDTGVSSSDGITMVTTPTLTGTATEAGGQIEVYEGDALLGSTDVGNDGAWTFTLGADKAFADGVHTLTVRQVDAAGNRGAASAPLAITVDTTAPTIAVSQSYAKSSANWHSLTFSEQVVFATNGSIDVLDSLGVGKSHHEWDVVYNWDIAADAQGVQNTLELNLGTLTGLFHLVENSNAIQDVAGNVAVIGTSDFSIGLA
ncbi:beta strand repeat-containing protein [Massilia rhizosphaerae]|uniref:beta strand repeat-containing protein n=1 Tax=Massilia rhizosphaerae TaxID=2784389 RepID=UPI0018DBCB38|nr:Ig-like domain-containing protein [Massilia rhizosphaerae]